MLDFPTSPNVGDTYASWRWDGARWVRVGGEGGGGDGSSGPWFPLMGVTDGSSAASGEIGELLSVYGNPSIPVGSWTMDGNRPRLNQTAASLMLTAGDWEVSAAIDFRIGTWTSTLNVMPLGSVQASLSGGVSIPYSQPAIMGFSTTRPNTDAVGTYSQLRAAGSVGTAAFKPTSSLTLGLNVLTLLDNNTVWPPTSYLCVLYGSIMARRMR